MMRKSLRRSPVTAALLLTGAVLSGVTGCSRSGETSGAADAAYQAELQKAQAARAAAEAECSSLPGAAKEDCGSVAAVEYERQVAEAKARLEKTGP